MSRSTRSEKRLLELFAVMQEDLVHARSVNSCPKRAYAIDRQVSRMRKRARITSADARATAIRNFLDANAHVRCFRVGLSRDDVANARHFITSVLERYTTDTDRDCIQETLALSHLVDLWRFGPGASNGISGTHAAEKIVQPMTCTTSCVPLVRMIRCLNPYLNAFDSLKANRGDLNVPCGAGISLVKGSRLATAKKNEETDRTIAIEASGNMCVQLAAGTYLEGGMRLIGLDIRSQQPKNKAMARRGSVDGSVCTIDLTQASDMEPVELVQLLMPPKWFDLLSACRSTHIEIDGHWVELSMMSTMGNGFTFPLMTLLIVSLIYAYRCRNGGPSLYVDWTNTCVFGDDIIVPTNEYFGVCEVLTQAGFRVNHAKSYHDGPFRESCGGDYYEGFDVTPFYVKSLTDDRDVYVVLNQVFEWCAKLGIKPLFRTIDLLVSFLDGEAHFVPEWHGPDEGFRTPVVNRRYKYLRSKTVQVRLGSEMEYFLVPLACGGYVSSHGPHVFATPRPLHKPGYSVKAARLPSGYLDGADPLSRPASISSYIGQYSFLVANWT